MKPKKKRLTPEEIKQSINVSALPDVVSDSNMFIDVITRSTDIIADGIVTVDPDVKNRKKIFFLQSESGLRIASCTFTASGGLAIDYKEISTGTLDINTETCKDVLAGKFSSELFNMRDDEIPPTIEEFWINGQEVLAKNRLEKIYWQGNISSGTGVFQVIDGILLQLANDATSQLGIAVTGSISTTTLTVTAVSKGITDADGEKIYLKPGMLLTGASIASNPCYIIEQLTPSGGGGGIGTYKISQSQTAASGTINANSVINPNPIFEGTQTTTTLTVTKVVQGYLRVGQTITTAGGVAVTSQTIIAQLTGEDGGVGTYTVSVSQSIAAATAMKAKFDKFTEKNILYIMKDIFSAVPEELRMGNEAGVVMQMVFPTSAKQAIIGAQTIQQRDNFSNALWNINNAGLVVNGDSITYLGMPVKFSSGLPQNTMVCTYKENLIYGSFASPSLPPLNLIDMEQTTGEKKLRMISPSFDIGALYGQGSHIIYIS